MTTCFVCGGDYAQHEYVKFGKTFLKSVCTQCGTRGFQESVHKQNLETLDTISDMVALGDKIAHVVCIDDQWYIHKLYDDHVIAKKAFVKLRTKLNVLDNGKPLTLNVLRKLKQNQYSNKYRRKHK